MKYGLEKMGVQYHQEKHFYVIFQMKEFQVQQFGFIRSLEIITKLETK